MYHVVQNTLNVQTGNALFIKYNMHALKVNIIWNT